MQPPKRRRSMWIWWLIGSYLATLASLAIGGALVFGTLLFADYDEQPNSAWAVTTGSVLVLSVIVGFFIGAFISQRRSGGHAVWAVVLGAVILPFLTVAAFAA